MKCENRLYKNNCQFLAKHKNADVDDCTAFSSETEFIVKIRNDAVKKFAESLKRKSELVAPSVWAMPYRAVAVADIDKLLEEMGCNDG